MKNEKEQTPLGDGIYEFEIISSSVLNENSRKKLRLEVKEVKSNKTLQIIFAVDATDSWKENRLAEFLRALGAPGELQRFDTDSLIGKRFSGRVFTVEKDGEKFKNIIEFNKVHEEDNESPQVTNIYKEFQTDIAELTVVGETELGILILLVAVSSYLPKPLNLSVRGPSSAGKSFVIKKILSLLPHDKVVTLAYLSPKALFHWKG